MIDHAQRIRAQHLQALINVDMQELENHAAPLFFMVFVLLAALVLSALATSISNYRNLVAVNDAMAACLSGHTIGMGDADVKCKVNEYKPLVAGLATGSQP